MFATLRRIFRASLRHGFALLLAFIVAGYGLSLLKPGRVAAAPEDATVTKWKKVALSDVALNERLMALEAIKVAGGTAAEDALEDIAKKATLRVSAAACAALGRMQSSGSKTKLKAVLENTRLPEKARMAAASCIAEHWRDEGDASYLEEKCEGSDALEAHGAVVRARVYGE